MNYHGHGEQIVGGMQTNQRCHNANKDNVTYIKVQQRISMWPLYVHQVHSFVQLGLGQTWGGAGHWTRRVSSMSNTNFYCEAEN